MEEHVIRQLSAVMVEMIAKMVLMKTVKSAYSLEQKENFHHFRFFDGPNAHSGGRNNSESL